MNAKQRYLMFISYLGSGLWGSQLQTYRGCGSTFETVQYIFENGLKNIFQLTEERPIRVRLPSRTDRGVHALRAALQVDLPQFGGNFVKPNRLKLLLNSYFANFKNVRVLEVYTVPDSFNISKQVLGKTYLFRCGVLHTELYEQRREITPPLMEIDRTHLFSAKFEFDLSKAEEATPLFEGKKDFGAIVGKPKQNTVPTICNIKSFKLERAQPILPFDSSAKRYNFYHFTCKGDKFLRYMVRRMVTLALSVGFNLITSDDIQKLFDEPVPSSWPRHLNEVVPGCGLYLADVDIDLQNIRENNEVFEVQNNEISSLGEC